MILNMHSQPQKASGACAAGQGPSNKLVLSIIMMVDLCNIDLPHHGYTAVLLTVKIAITERQHHAYVININMLIIRSRLSKCPHVQAGEVLPCTVAG